jgi:hypothetical protein
MDESPSCKKVPLKSKEGCVINIIFIKLSKMETNQEDEEEKKDATI